MRFQALVLFPLAVVAGGGSEEQGSKEGYVPPGETICTTTTTPLPEYIYDTTTTTVPYQIDHTTTVPEPVAYTTTVPYQVDHTATSLEQVKYTTTVPYQVEHTTTVPIPTVIKSTDFIEFTETSHIYSTDTLVQTRLWINTSIITTISYITIIPPALEVTTTYTAFPTPSCDFCKVDIYGTELVYPTSFTTETAYSITLGLYTSLVDGTLLVTTSTTTAIPCGTTEGPRVWYWNGVELTSGTTYIGYTTFFHEWLFPSAGVAGGCGLSTLPLDLPSPTTDWAALLIATTAIPTTPTYAPTLIVDYLDSFSTITAQLNGTRAASCDYPAQTVKPNDAIATGTTTTTLGGQKVYQHPLISPAVLAPGAGSSAGTSPTTEAGPTSPGAGASVSPGGLVTPNSKADTSPTGGAPSSSNGARTTGGSTLVSPGLVSSGGTGNILSTGASASPTGASADTETAPAGIGSTGATPSSGAVTSPVRTIYGSIPTAYIVGTGASASTIPVPASDLSSLASSLSAEASSVVGVESSSAAGKISSGAASASGAVGSLSEAASSLSGAPASISSAAASSTTAPAVGSSSVASSSAAATRSSRAQTNHAFSGLTLSLFSVFAVCLSL